VPAEKAGNLLLERRACSKRRVPYLPVTPEVAGSSPVFATRENVRDRWSAPVNLGDAVNTAENETRPSLSWKGTTLYFGRAPAPVGPADIFVTTREKTGG
jgi:hypothetical protein